MQGDRARNHHYDLLDLDPRKGLVSLALPMIIAFLFQTGFNIVDTIFVGRLGAEAIAGVSLAFPFQMFIIALSSGLGIGAQSLIARSIGAGRKPDADKAAGHVFLIMIVSSALTTLIGLSLAPYLISYLDAPEEVGRRCLEYLGPILMGSFFIYHNIMLNAVFRGEGDTKRPMYFMATGAILNVIFDPIFIFSFDLGVSGAAIATILSRMIVSTLSMYYIFVRKGTFVSLHRDSFKLDIGIIRRIFDVGIPASLAQLAMSLSLFFLNDLVAPFGQNALAAFGIGFRVESVVFLPMIGLSGA
ncbi:MAG: MATE family efflux transporter, partial [Candidatus Methanofastidiosa archaeon]|nr:MATE family efflux transporter [Candidatus Methanofastidiosa archaeon]